MKTLFLIIAIISLTIVVFGHSEKYTKWKLNLWVIEIEETGGFMPRWYWFVSIITFALSVGIGSIYPY